VLCTVHVARERGLAESRHKGTYCRSIEAENALHYVRVTYYLDQREGTLPAAHHTQEKLPS